MRHRRVVLQPGRLVVTKQTARVSHEDARPRDLVRSVELVPRLDRPPQVDERLARLPVREVHRAARVRDHGSQHRALVSGRDLLELDAGATSRVVLSSRQHDLDEGGQESRPVERRRRGRLGASDRRDGCVGAALRQSQLSEPWLRLPPERARLPVRLLGAPEVALQAQELALPVAGEPGGAIPRLDEALAGAPRLLERGAPRAVELHDLRPVHQAAAGEGDHLRLQRPPVRERPRPLSRPRYLVHLLARENHAAVDDPRDDRRELLRGHGEHAFVEKREAVAHPTVLDQHVALGMDREREEVAIAETLTELDRLFGDRRGRGEVPGRLLLEDAG